MRREGDVTPDIRRRCDCDPDADGTAARGCPVHWPVPAPSEDPYAPVPRHGAWSGLDADNPPY